MQTKTKIQNQNYRIPGDKKMESGRAATQLGWYKFVSEFCKSKIVLDVGCGLGAGLQILAQYASSAHGIDLDQRLNKQNIMIKSIEEISDKSYDLVVAIDVIEHVENDVDFLKNLVRVARQTIIISTPNFTASRCSWPYHVREYMPHELIKLLKPYGTLRLFKGSSNGDKVFPIRYLYPYIGLCKLRVNCFSGFFTRCVNNLIPNRCRIHSSLLAILQLN